jgi:hypothetical protein
VQGLREQFKQHTLTLSQEDLKRFRFLDESGLHLGMTRLYGRAEPGQRVPEGTPGCSGAHYTVVATLSVEGIRAPLVFEGAMDQGMFEGYLEQVLIPDLKRGDVLVLDNLSAHKLPSLQNKLAAQEVTLIFLPPYSSDLNSQPD